MKDYLWLHNVKLIFRCIDLFYPYMYVFNEIKSDNEIILGY